MLFSGNPGLENLDMPEKKVLVSFHRAPYGTIFYTEGLRAALGVTSGIDENEVTALFIGDGVYFALKDIDRTDTSKYLATLAKIGAPLYAEEESLCERGINKEDMADDIKIIPRSEVLALYKEADCNIDF
jgi:sulfur relay (sulfurtransferase) DsrF/TusC family protein